MPLSPVTVPNASRGTPHSSARRSKSACVHRWRRPAATSASSRSCSAVASAVDLTRARLARSAAALASRRACRACSCFDVPDLDGYRVAWGSSSKPIAARVFSSALRMVPRWYSVALASVSSGAAPGAPLSAVGGRIASRRPSSAAPASATLPRVTRGVSGGCRTDQLAPDRPTGAGDRDSPNRAAHAHRTPRVTDTRRRAPEPRRGVRHRLQASPGAGRGGVESPYGRGDRGEA